MPGARDRQYQALSALTASSIPGFKPELNGLRATLALSVFVGHAVYTYGRWTTGHWGASHWVFGRLASFSVEVFFALSGYLFWRRLLRCDGRLDWGTFLRSRASRICPAYYASLLPLVVICFFHSRFRLQVTPAEAFLQVGQWALFGFPNGALPDINGLEQSRLVGAGVAWSLYYEWLFYFSLPMLAVFARRGRTVVLVTGSFVVMACLTPFLHYRDWPLLSATAYFFRYLAVSFGMGITAAYVETSPRAEAFRGALRRWSWLPPIAYVLGLYWYPVQWLRPGLVFLVIAPISFGNDVFGLLARRSVQRFGEISYSFYLIHGLALYIVCHALNRMTSLSAMTPAAFFPISLLAGIVATAWSIFSHRYFELPFTRATARTPTFPGTLQCSNQALL